MAATAQPSGLMDIASSLTQDEIPFKLRCAICNKLAVNAFRLPCCDQAICENCQASLPDTCPVCAHTPISSDLCKPNKALRTTLKAFLRTEEKKREKERQERQAAQPATSDETAPAEESSVRQEPQQHSHAVEETPVDGPLPNAAEGPSAAQPVDTAPSAAEVDAPREEQVETNGVSQDEQPEAAAPDAADRTLDAEQKNAEGDNTENNESTEQPEQDAQNAMLDAGFPNPMGFNMNPGMFPNMAWGTNSMAQFMGGGMMGFPNTMGMAAMGMDPMAASQGMFGGYGMNMNGMSNGMNMGMNFNAGQGMYGGWDGSQNNMWNGSQDKFNPNAFANGMGAQFGDPSGFGGYNMSQPNGVHPQMQQQQQFPNQEFQNGYHGPGTYRGRGRGYHSGGRGRGGYSGHVQPNFPHNANSAALQDNTFNADQIMPSQTEEGAADATAIQDNMPSEVKNGEDGSNTAAASFRDQVLNDVEVNGGNAASVPGTDGHPDQAVHAEHQLQGIPTVDSLSQPYNVGATAAPTHMPQGFGRGGGYMRGGFHGRGGSFGGQQQFIPAPNMQPRGPGVEGAPAAPRAMRQGLPNTSVFRQRNFQLIGRGSNTPGRGPETSETPHTEPTSEDQRPLSTTRSISRARSRSRSRSKPRSRSRSGSRVRSRSNSRRRYRPRSRSVEDAVDYDRKRERRRRPHHDERDRTADDERRTRSPSIESHRSSLRDKERDQRRARRSRRSHRRRSRSRTASGDRNGDSRDNDRLSSIAEERNSSKPRSRDADTLNTRRSGKDRSSRRDEDRERDRDARRRDRERERDRDRDRDRHREKERERDRERDRDRPRERDRDRKRSRRDRSESAADSDYHSRKIKRGRDDDTRTSISNRDRPKDIREKTLPTNPPESEKDPHTLEREARNRERLLKEQQRREAMQADRDAGKSSRRRDSRQERSGRRLNYKYDDETDAARAAKVEREREGARWE